MNPTVKGAALSKTVWLGLAITLLGYFQANLELVRVILLPFLPPERVEQYMGAFNMALGVAVIIVRFYTTSSLAEK